MCPDRFEDIDRRTFVKGAAATGVAATGVGAFSGGAAAQQTVPIDTSNLQITSQRGQQQAAGLIVVQLQNLDVELQDVVDVVVQVGDDVVSVQNVRILNNNNVQLNVSDLVDVAGNTVQVAVTLLGQTAQQGETEFVGSTAADVLQAAQQ